MNFPKYFVAEMDALNLEKALKVKMIPRSFFVLHTFLTK